MDRSIDRPPFRLMFAVRPLSFRRESHKTRSIAVRASRAASRSGGRPFTRGGANATLIVTITDKSTSAQANLSFPIDIPATIGSNLAYVGFTGGTGGLSAVQTIQNWTMTPGPQTVGMAKFESINDFVAPSTGTYYVQVTGSPGLQYDLVAARGSNFDLHGNSFANAQPLGSSGVDLGAIVKGISQLQTLDNINGQISPIYQTDTGTGAFGHSIPSPIPAGFYLFGQNMAFDGTYTYYNDGYHGLRRDLHVLQRRLRRLGQHLQARSDRRRGRHGQRAR
jgi:hypothetical protein